MSATSNGGLALPVLLTLALGCGLLAGCAGDGGGDEGPRADRLERAHTIRDEIEQTHLEAYLAWIDTDMEGELDPGIGPWVDSLTTRLTGERDPEVRAALWLTRLWAGYAGATVTADTAELILHEAGPASEAWTRRPEDAANLIRYATRLAAGVPEVATGGRGPAGLSDEAKDRLNSADLRFAALMTSLIDAHPDSAVRPALLLGALREANRSGHADLAGVYHQRLTGDHPASPEAAQAAGLAPDRRVWVGGALPDLPLPSLDAASPPILPADLAGPATLVDFWAVWCLPCIAELPTLRHLYDRYADRGFRIVSVSYDRDRETVRSFHQREPMPWEHAFAEEGWGARGPIALAYGVSALPSKVLVGPDGRVLGAPGDLRGDGLEETIRRLFP
jgi:thiol-disulfide isomerase/thioredoxin